MFRRGRARLALVAVAVAVHVVDGPSAATSDVGVPKGKRTPRRPATHVVLRRVDLDAQGARLALAPGVGVVVPGGRTDTPLAGRVSVTLAGAAELTGWVDGASLGARLARAVPLGDPDGPRPTPIGQGLEGAMVAVVGRGPDKGTVVCETTGSIHARVVIPTDALTADARELVYPVVSERLETIASDADLLAEPTADHTSRTRGRLARGAKVAIAAQADTRWVRVRTTGAFAIEGFVARDRLGPAGDAAEPDEPAPPGLTPTHEVLVEAQASADPAGKRPIGLLHGGALLAVGIQVVGPRVRVMTYGDVVGEMWVPSAALRPLEREIWNERP